MTDSSQSLPGSPVKGVRSRFPVALLAIAVMAANRAPICVVIASDQNRPSASRPDEGLPPEPGSRRHGEFDDDIRRLEELFSSPTPKTESAHAAKIKEIAGQAPSAEIDVDFDLSSIGATAGGDDDSTRTRELSVQPKTPTRPILPEDRPAWVGSPPDLTRRQHRVFVGSSPEMTAEAAERSLDAAMVEALKDYVDNHVLQEKGAAARLTIGADYARKNLLDDSEGYLAELSTSQGPMFQKWVILHVSPEQREQFAVWRREALQRAKMGGIGLMLLAILGVTGTAHLVLSIRSRRRETTPLPFELQPMLAANPKRSRGLLHKLVVSGVMVAIAVAVVSALTLVKVARSAPSKGSIKSDVLYEGVRFKVLRDNWRPDKLQIKYFEREL